MKKPLALVLGLLAFTALSPLFAGDKTYPPKQPVLSYALPEGWTTETDAKDGSISLNAPSGHISVNFAPVPIEATMDMFEKMLPDMVKALGEDATVVDKPTAHTEDGLSGFTATYAAKIEGKPAMAIMVLFKGEDEHAVLGNIIVSDPEKLSKEDGAAFKGFMKSMKGAAK